MALLVLQETEETPAKGGLKGPKARQEMLVRLESVVIQGPQAETTLREDRKVTQAMLAQRESQGWMEIREVLVNQADGALMVDEGLLVKLVLLEDLEVMV